MFLAGAVYVVSGAVIGTLIWRQNRRQDSEARILGVAPRTRARETLALVLAAAILALFPTVVYAALFGI